jgi:hypothetical protein
MQQLIQKTGPRLRIGILEHLADRLPERSRAIRGASDLVKV